MIMLMLEQGDISLACPMLLVCPPSPDHVSGILGLFCRSFSCIEQRKSIRFMSKRRVCLLAYAINMVTTIVDC